MTTLAGSRAGLLAGLAMIAIASQFFRSSLSVIAPDLIRDLSLTPQSLGMAGGMFFFALGVAQVPVGMAFDRIGPRMTVAWVSVFALAGAATLAVATSAAQLVAGRFLLGVGCGASFMSCVVMLIRWYPHERIGTMYGRIFAISQVGNLIAATPMAWMSEAFGWRAVFGGSAVVIVVVVAFFLWAARDQPAGQAPVRAHAEPLWQTLRGFGQVLRLPGYGKVVAIHTVAYAVLATVFGLWAGPYLHDVFGLDGAARGNVLLAMTVAQTAGLLWLVPLERRLNTRKGVIIGAASCVIVLLVLLASLGEPPKWLAIGALVMLAAVNTYSPIIIAHAASLVPPVLQGRGSATANIGQVTGSFLMPVATGAIAGLFERTGTGGYPPLAYQLIFASMAAALACGVAVYWRAADCRPQAPAHPDDRATDTARP